MTTRMKNNGDENDSNPYCRYTTWSLKQDKEESVEEKATQQSDHQIFFFNIRTGFFELIKFL